jgi:hypothetical protein
MATLGVEMGWQPSPDGGIEYIIQVKPHMLQILASGEDICCDIPPKVRGGHCFRLTAGTEELPREGRPEPEPAAMPPSETPPPGAPAPMPSLMQPRYPGLGETPAPEPEVGRATIPSESGPSAAPPWETPRPLPPPTDTQPLSGSGEKPAMFVEEEPAMPSPPEPENQEKAPGTAQQQEPEKPWAPFTLALAGFFGSFGGMLYTGWLAWGYRRKYHSLLQQMIDAGHAPAEWSSLREAEPGGIAGASFDGEDEPSES